MGVCVFGGEGRTKRAYGNSSFMLISLLTFYGFLLLEIIPSLLTSKGCKDKLR